MSDPAGRPVASPGPDQSPEPADRTGPRRVLVALYAVFALAATARAVVQIVTKFDTAPLAYLLSLLSGLVYIAATIGLTSPRPRARRLAWSAVSVELVGVLVVGTLSIADAVAFPRDSVWSRFGSGYGYVPLVLPLVGMYYLWWTRRRQPDRGVTAAG